MAKVTDPALIAALDKQADAPAPGKVTDPALLAKLDASAAAPESAPRKDPTVADVIPWVKAQHQGMSNADMLHDYVVRGVQPGTDTPNEVQVVLRGAPQGMSYGWSDEAASYPEAVKNYVLNKINGTQSDSFETTRQEALAEIRAKNAAAQKANPLAYDLSEIGGAFLAPSPGFDKASKLKNVALRVGAKTAIGAGEGALFNAGLADQDKAGAAWNGAKVGAVLGAGGAAADEALAFVRGLANNRVEQARGKARGEAEKEKAKEIAQASGSYGHDVQEGSRFLENVKREFPDMTPEEQHKMAELLANGNVDAVRRQVVGSTLERIPGQADKIAAKKTALDDLIAGKDDAIRQRTEELSRPTFGADAKTLFKQYGEPWLGATFGAGVGSLVGHYVLPELGFDPNALGVAGLGGVLGKIGSEIHGRTRMGKAINLRWNRPGNQIGMWSAVERAASGRVGNIATPGSAVTGAGEDPADHFVRWMTDPQYRTAR
jgi:hypothetical protein